MTNQNQTIPNYEVHCGKCGWWGYMSQLKAAYGIIPPDNVAAEPGCPQCLSGWLEYDGSLYVALYAAIGNLVLAEHQFNQAMENLHCEISRQQS